MIDINKKYVINPDYILKNDKKRILLYFRYNPLFHPQSEYDSEARFFSFIHPKQAKIFTLFNGKRSLLDIINEIAKMLNVSIDRSIELITPFIENKKTLGINYQNNKFAIPKQMLVPIKENSTIFSYNKEDFECKEFDFKQRRIINYPLEVTLMLNTICEVDCIYCYADCRKKMDCQIPIETLDKLIDDCQKNDVRAFNLMGGEVLKYKNWKWLLTKLISCGYTPYISTKIPLKESIVDELHSIGIRSFQISLDSFDVNILEKNLNIKNGNVYLENMKKTLSYFEKIGIDLYIHAVITAYNKDVKHLKEYLNNLSHFKNIKNVQISIVGESLYKDGYQKHKLNRVDVKKISEFINEISIASTYTFSISFSPGAIRDIFFEDEKTKEEKFNKRGICTANIFQIFILPDGNVTICEELMFNPRFFLGNILTKNLKTIWEENKLSSLSNHKLYKNSNCGQCKKYTFCKGTESRGVCWKEIIHAYGEDKWNYPDPKCPYAPKEMNQFYII